MVCENLLFRRPESRDVEEIRVLKNNKKAALLLGGIHRIYTSEDIEKWILFHNSNSDEVLFVIEDRDAGKLIGHVGLYKIDRIAKKTEIGILIADDDSRGKGFGTKTTMLMIDYAFDKLGMHKVTAEVLSENLPSIAMFKKCGFSVDGCLRDDIFKNERYYDVLSMSILKEEFLQNKTVENNQ